MLMKQIIAQCAEAAKKQQQHNKMDFLPIWELPLAS